MLKNFIFNVEHFTTFLNALFRFENGYTSTDLRKPEITKRVKTEHKYMKGLAKSFEPTYYFKLTL